jgi:hypothetical protein
MAVLVTGHPYVDGPGLARSMQRRVEAIAIICPVC